MNCTKRLAQYGYGLCIQVLQVLQNVAYFLAKFISWRKVLQVVQILEWSILPRGILWY